MARHAAGDGEGINDPLRRLVCLKAEEAGGTRLRLLNPRERPLGEQVTLRRYYQERPYAESGEFYPVIVTSGDVAIESYGAMPEEPDKKVRLLVARIAALGTAMAIAFLAAEMFQIS
jgi:hypothetical protein